jgi:hypothetical protein
MRDAVGVEAPKTNKYNTLTSELAAKVDTLESRQQNLLSRLIRFTNDGQDDKCKRDVPVTNCPPGLYTIQESIGKIGVMTERINRIMDDLEI